MAKACGINLFEESNKRIKEKYPEIKMDKNVDRETDTSFLGRMYESVKNLPKKMADSSFVSHYWKNAAVADLVSSLKDVNKIRARWSGINKQIKLAKAPLNGDPNGLALWEGYNRSRSELREAMYIRDNNEGVSIPKEIESVLGFVNFRKNYKGKGEATLDKYIERLKEINKDFKQEVLTNEATLEVHKRMQGLAQRRLERMIRIDKEATQDIVGKFDNPMDVLDNLELRLRTADTHQRDFYKMTLGIDVDLSLNSEHKLDFVTHHMLDMYEKGIELMNYLKKDSANEKFMESFLNERKDISVVDFGYIKNLQEGHNLKSLHNELVNIVTENENTIKTFSEAFKIKKEVASDTQKLMYAAELSNATILKQNLGAIGDAGLRNTVSQNKKLYKNLNNFFNNGNNYDIAQIGRELLLLKDVKDPEGYLKSAMINKLSYNQHIINEYRKAIKSEMLGNAQEMLADLAKKFPDHSIMTLNGTKVLDVTGNIRSQDIANNQEILGHLADLTNPDIISKDFITMKEIQEMGLDKIKEKLIDGRILIVPNKKLEVIRRVKEDINKYANKGLLKTLNGMFSKYTLFAPWAYPGYALTTQIFGNVGHTMMGDPTAFKHWPKFMVEVKKAWKGDYHLIENEDMREIIRSLLTTENGSLHNVTSEDWNDIGWEEIKNTIDERTGKVNKNKAKKIIDKYMAGTTKVASIIEMVSRGSMAYESLLKKRADKTWLPTTANPHRVEHLWDYDPHLAAVRLANDAHIDYGAAHGLVRQLSRYSPFLSFKVGSSVNMVRSWVNTYQSVANAMRGNGDWRHARTHLSRGAIGLLWRAGAAATIWTAIMVATGKYSEEDRKRNNSFGGSIINSIFGKMGIHFDNHIYIPGTGIKLVDSMLRLGKANRKWDVFESAEGMIPGLDKKWRDSFKEEGFTGIAKTASGMFASSLTPVFKTPIEMFLGGGSIYENGYHAPDRRISQTESYVTKLMGFIGASSITRTAINMKEGIDTEYKSPAAYDVNEFKGRIDALSRTKEDEATYEASKLLSSAMSHFNTQWTVEAIRGLEHAYQAQAAADGKKLSASAIEHKMREHIMSATLQHKVRTNKKWYNALTADEKQRVIRSIEAEKTFLQSLGIGRF